MAKQIITRIYDKYDKAVTKTEVKNKIQEVKKVEEKKEPVKSQKMSVEEVVSTPPPPPSHPPSSSENEENNDLKKKQEYFQKCPESYNGAIREKYSWSQSIKDLDVKIRVNPVLISIT